MSIAPRLEHADDGPLTVPKRDPAADLESSKLLLRAAPHDRFPQAGLEHATCHEFQLGSDGAGLRSDAANGETGTRSVLLA